MRENSAFKHAVRARMRVTGENYTTAARRLRTDAAADPAASPLAVAAEPGTLTLLVAGGGQTNTAFALPEMIAAGRRGHPIVLVSGDREGVIELPSVVDLLAGEGLVDVDHVGHDLRVDGFDVIDAATRESRIKNVMWLDGETSAVALTAELRALRNTHGKSPWVWVQDVQVAGPIGGVPYGYRGVGVQCEALARVAHDSGACIVAGHCMPADDEDGWRVATDQAAAAFVIEYEDDGGGDVREVTLNRLEKGEKIETIPWQINHRPFGWRNSYLRPGV